MAATYGQPPLWQKLAMVPLVGATLLSAVYYTLTAPFRGNNAAPKASKHVAYSATKWILSTASIAQTQWVLGGTEANFLGLAKSNKFTPEVILLPDGTKAYFIGKKSAKKLLLYFHGGGYCLPLLPACGQYLMNLHKTMSEQGLDFAIVVLVYDLAPKARYPRPIEQAAALINHLVKVEKRDTSDIAIGGDSAGGNLTLALMSHMLHPHPAGIEAVTIPSPFALALLISPWADFDVNTASFAANVHSDSIPKVSAVAWAEAYLGNAEADNWNQPGRAGAKWWENISKITDETVVYGGEGELLIDHIKKVASDLGKDTETIWAERECHEEVIIDAGFYYPKSEAQKSIEASLYRALKGN